MNLYRLFQMFQSCSLLTKPKSEREMKLQMKLLKAAAVVSAVNSGIFIHYPKSSHFEQSAQFPNHAMITDFPGSAMMQLSSRSFVSVQDNQDTSSHYIYDVAICVPDNL